MIDRLQPAVAIAALFCIWAIPGPAAGQEEAGESGSLGEASAVKVAYIDSEQLLAEAPGRRIADRIFTQETRLWRSRADSLRQIGEVLAKTLEDGGVRLPPAERQGLTDRLAEAEAEYAELMEETFGPGGRADQLEAELMAPILEMVNQAVREIREEEGYVVILDLKSGVILAADEDLDITGRILRRLREMPAPEIGGRR